jgi:hypothetical protein
LGGGIIRVAMRGRGDDGKVLENLNGFGCHFGPFRNMWKKIMSIKRDLIFPSISVKGQNRDSFPYSVVMADPSRDLPSKRVC